MQAASHEIIFHEVILPGLGSQVAPKQLVAIDRTKLFFELVDQFLDQGIVDLERFGGCIPAGDEINAHDRPAERSTHATCARNAAFIIPDFENCVNGKNERKITVSSEAIRYISTGILSAHVYGVNVDNEIVDLGSNSLWITNTDELNQRQSFLTSKDEETGSLLREMLIGSDAEWHELLNSINLLVDLDVRKIQSISRVKGSEDKKKKKFEEEAETTIQLIEDTSDQYQGDIDAEIYNESRLRTWIEIVSGQFPGRSIKLPTETSTPAIETQKKRTQHKPNPNLARQFVGLVKRYIRSLNNPEFMKYASAHYLLAYFSIFHRLIRLLLKHKVIDNLTYGLFLTKINNGYFGDPGEGKAPLENPDTFNHLEKKYKGQWIENFVHLHALSSLFHLEALMRKEDALEQTDFCIEDSYTQILACCFCVFSPTELFITEDIEFFSRSFGIDSLTLRNRLEQILQKYSKNSLAKLIQWSDHIYMKMKDRQSEKINLLNVLVNVGIGSERICDYLGLTEQRINHCTDIAFTANRLGDIELANTYQQLLIQLLRDRGDLPSLARALINQGREYTIEQNYDQAVLSLLQAQAIAIELSDASLLKNVQIHLSAAQFLSRSYK